MSQGITTTASTALEAGVVLRCRVGQSDHADLIWTDGECEFWLTVAYETLRVLVEHGAAALAAMRRCAEDERAGREPELTVIGGDR